ncbi:MAG: flagellar basal body protein [Rhizomicrobium sp.]
MNLPDLPLLSMLRQRMSWLNQRQDVLAQNVANADTPGYVARDLKPLDFGEMLRGQGVGAFPGLAITDPRDIAAPLPGGSSQFQDVKTPDSESTLNGNQVSVEAEMIKVSDTEAQFQTAADLYGKAMSLMKTAIGQP